MTVLTLRHCERSEAIQGGSPRGCAPRDDEEFGCAPRDDGEFGFALRDDGAYILRHCERSEAIQSSSLTKGLMPFRSCLLVHGADALRRLYFA